MTKFCYTFELLPGVNDEYDRRHAALDPAVIAAMRDAGIDDFRLFRRGSTVIAVGDARRPVADVFADLDANDANQRWSTAIRSLMSSATDENGELLFAEEIWHLPREDRG